MAGKRYSVVQWCTGNVGSRALRRAIEHPDLDVIGVYVHSADKAGRDAGELAGVEPVGIKATNSIDDVIALKPDCVLYMPHIMNYDEVVYILESGSNIITTRTEFQNPAMMDPDIRARVEAACAQGNSSIHGTGSSPGFISEAFPIVLASIQRRLDCLTIYEFGPSESRNSPEMLFGYMGFGSKPDGPNQAILDFKRETFSGTLGLIADALGLPLDGVRASGALGIARNDVHIIAGTVPKGTVAATKTTIEGMRNGKPLLRMVANWSVSSDVDTTDGEEWEFRESGWRVVVEGDCPLSIDITFPVAPEDYAEMTPGLTAHRPVNMVSYVCDAQAGIRTTVDLPQVIAKLG
ncbi:MAG TPA: dihydrodipicolinate reductase [Sphingobium sp.]|uniref:NAD(P)H-dependent amine dehydrogenase family protein n=1 Tax=Sphingobium sp. TaxID=1912891 RepID=UPI002ED30902